MNTTAYFDQGSLAALAVAGGVRCMIWPLWAILRALVGLAHLWRPVALVAALVATVTVSLACPALPLGLTLVAIFGWVTYPGKRGR